MNPIIKIDAFHVNINGTYKYFGDETGTPEFYKVSDTLNKYLGEYDIWVSWDYNDFYFIIHNSDSLDEGCDTIYDYIQIIESIWEPFDYPEGIFDYYKNDHLVFNVIYDDY